MLLKIFIIIISVLMISTLIIISISCNPDIVLSGSDSFAGDYSGVYLYWDSQTDDTLSQAILWTFTEDNRYYMKIDTASEFFTDFCVCETFGLYGFDYGVRLEEIGYSPNGILCEACNEKYNPTGIFDVKLPSDSLIMSQLLTYDNLTVFKQISLKRIDDTDVAEED